MFSTRSVFSSLLCSIVIFRGFESGNFQEETKRNTAITDRNLESRLGAGWKISRDCCSTAPSFLYGGRIPAPFIPKEENEFEALARYRIDELSDVFGFEAASLQVKKIKSLNLSAIGSSDKVAVCFEQMAGPLKVFRGSVTVLMEAETGDTLALYNQGLSQIEQIAFQPILNADLAVEAGQIAYSQHFGVQAQQIDKVELLVVGPSGYFSGNGAVQPSGPTTCYLIEYSSPHAQSADGLPIAGRVFVSARDLNIFKVESTIYTSVSGNVKAYANTGPETPSLGNQELVNLANIWVRAGAQNSPVLATTDDSGNFSINSDNPLDLFFRLEGPFCEVRTMNGNGEDLSFTRNDVGGSTSVNLVFNSTRQEFGSAQTTTYYWVNEFRNWILATDPDDDSMDFSITSNVNINEFCNAFWNGGSINMYRAGNGCVNTAYRSIILHEEGHWANFVYNGYPTAAFHEGIADVWASYIADDSCLGLELNGIGTGCARNGNQDLRLKCPGNCDEFCHGGESHNEGEVIASAIWKTRVNLKTQFGNESGKQIANLLFLSWMQTYDDGMICNDILDHWLALDDNDGNIENYTPHYGAINGGFAAQGWPTETTQGPPPPTNVSAADAGDCNFVRVSWSPSVSATNYSVWRNTSNNNSSSIQLALDNVSPFDDYSAEPGQNYYYWVRAISNLGVSPFSSPNAGSLASSPAAPTGVNASDGQYCDKVQVSWNNLQSTSYSILRSTNSSSQNATPIGTASSSPFNDTSASPGQNYYYWVRAISDCGESTLSQSNTGSKALPLQSSPIVNASNGTVCSGIEVSWNAVAGAQSYSIWASTTPVFANAAQVGTDNQSPFFHGGMSPGATRYYWVSAINVCGNGPFNSNPASGFRSPSGIPTTPSNVQASDGAFCNKIQITWSPVTGANQYSIWRGGNNQTQQASLIGISTTSLYEDFPANTDSYYYWVKAENGCGISPFSAVNTGFRTRAPAMQAPVVASNGTGCHSIQVSWPVAANASFYKIYRGTSPYEANANWLADDVESPYVDSTVQDGISYFYFVRAANNCGVSTSFSDNGYAGTTVSAPTGLSSTNFCDRVQLNWNHVPGVSNYQVLRSNSVNGAAAVVIASPTQTSFADTSAQPGIFYWYWVKAQSGCNTSNVSNYRTGRRLSCD